MCVHDKKEMREGNHETYCIMAKRNKHDIMTLLMFINQSASTILLKILLSIAKIAAHTTIDVSFCVRVRATRNSC